MNSQTKLWNTHNWVNYYGLCDEIPELLIMNKVFFYKSNYSFWENLEYILMVQEWYIQFKKLSKYLRERGLLGLLGKKMREGE